MCTYQTETLQVNASAKTPQGWARVNDASVYFDHPVHFMANHAVMIDLMGQRDGSTARVGIEMDAASARALAEAILKTVSEAPPALLDDAVTH